MMRYVLWKFAAAVFAVLVARAVMADEAQINYQQFYGQGFASDQEMEEALGSLSFSMTECRKSGLGNNTSRVSVTSSKSNYGKPQVIEGMLHRAAEFAWQNCQIHFIFGVTEVEAVHRNIESVELYLPDGSVAIQASNLFGDEAFDPGRSYKWGAVHDAGEQRRQEAAWQATKVQQEQQRAESYARYQAEQDRFWSDVWSWIKLLFWGAIALWALSQYKTIMRWYYMLTPHPATSMVEAAMHRRVELDGKAFADIMRPIPGGRIEKEVRAQQAHKLALKAQQYAEAMRAEADRIKAKAQQDTDFIKAQDVLAKAATAHEQAKAALDALRKRVG